MKALLFKIAVMAGMVLFFGCDKDDDSSNLPGNVIGIVNPEMDANKAHLRSQEAIIGNFVCDAYLEYAQNKGFEPDMAVCNSGDIRFNPDIHPDGIYPARLNVDTATIYEIFPWETGELSLVEITGAELYSTFERSVAALPPASTSYNGCFLQVSKEIKVEYDLSRQAQIIDKTDPDNPFIATEGQRVVSLKINDLEVDSAQSYKMVVPFWLVEGGDDYLVLKDIAAIKKQLLEEVPAPPMTMERKSLIYYLLKYQTINPALEGRIAFVTK